MYQISWLNAKPYCWLASTDGGKTWQKLRADNDEISSEAIDEAAQRFGVPTDKWDVLDDPINSTWEMIGRGGPMP